MFLLMQEPLDPHDKAQGPWLPGRPMPAGGRSPDAEERMTEWPSATQGQSGGGVTGNAYPVQVKAEQWWNYEQPFWHDVFLTHSANPLLSGWWARAAALILDQIILFVSLFLLASILVGIGTPGMIALLLCLLAGVMYSTFMIGHYGGTLGMAVASIRVVDIATGQHISFARSFVRILAFSLITLIPGLDLLNCLWPLWDLNHQALHDKVAATVVVKRSPTSFEGRPWMPPEPLRI